MIKVIRKINFISHDHLSSGNNNWSCVSKELKIFSNKKGINCYEWLDKNLKEKELNGDWIGFLHNTIEYPEDYPLKYKNKILCLRDLVKNAYFLDQLSSCKGIFVFTNQIKNYLIKKINFYKIEKVTHPCMNFNKKWNSFNFILHVGQQLRKYHSFLELKTSYKKIMIVPKNCEGDLIEMKTYSEKDVEYLNQMSLEEYIDQMCRSVVFLDLYDVAACNTILECIALNTPVLVKKLPGSIEYLGEDYPFYFDDLEEAELKIQNKQLIDQTHEYLKKMKKDSFSIKNFLFEIYKSKIFQNL